MLLLILAFTLLVAFSLCGYRLVYGPQKQLAAVGLAGGISGVCFCGIAYPQEQSAWLWAAYGAFGLMLLILLVLVGTSFSHWLRTPIGPQS